LDAAGIVASVRERLGSKEPRLVANS
jgi:hypothetical protein